MRKIIVITIAVVIVLIIAYVIFAPKLSAPTTEQKPAATNSAFDPKNSTFTINGTSVTLVNGESRTPAAPGSAAQVVTKYFGNDARGDLTRDDQDDIAFLITQDAGGSGLFYYAVVAIKTADGYKTTNAFLVGDRIAPQNNHIANGELDINFAERRAGEPMTAQPSQGAVLILKVTPAGVLEGLMS